MRGKTIQVAKRIYGKPDIDKWNLFPSNALTISYVAYMNASGQTVNYLGRTIPRTGSFAHIPIHLIK